MNPSRRQPRPGYVRPVPAPVPDIDFKLLALGLARVNRGNRHCRAWWRWW